MANISMNYQATAKARPMWAQAELAVAETLSKARHNKGLGTKQTTTNNHEGAEFVASYFHTTDQLGHYTYGSESFYTTDADVARIDNLNIKQDIDLLLVDQYKHKTERGGYIIKTIQSTPTVSVKSMSKAMETGNISLELKTFNRSQPHKYLKGWIYTSKADWYAFVIGLKVLVITKEKMLQVMEEGHWIVKDKLSDFAFQFNKDRFYNDAENMLLPIDALLEHSMVMDLPEWYTKAWKRSSTTSDKVLNISKTFWEKKGY